MVAFQVLEEVHKQARNPKEVQAKKNHKFKQSSQEGKYPEVQESSPMVLNIKKIMERSRKVVFHHPSRRHGKPQIFIPKPIYHHPPFPSLCVHGASRQGHG